MHDLLCDFHKHVYWAPKSVPCTSNIKSNQTGPCRDAASRITRKQTIKQTWQFSTVTATIAVGPGTSGTFGRWGEEAAKGCFLEERWYLLGVYLVLTMCRRKRPDLCLAGTCYLAGRQDVDTLQGDVYWRCYSSAWDGAASGSLATRDNTQIVALRFNMASPAPATPWGLDK